MEAIVSQNVNSTSMSPDKLVKDKGRVAKGGWKLLANLMSVALVWRSQSSCRDVFGRSDI